MASPVDPSSVQLLETTLKTRGEENCWLMDYHISRVTTSAKAMAEYFGNQGPFSNFPDKHTILAKVKDVIARAEAEDRESSQFRVRMLVGEDGNISCTVTPEPIRPSGSAPLKVVLDTEPIDREASHSFFLTHKTTFRAVYDAARRRHSVSLTDPQKPFDVVLYNSKGQITETTIANIAVQLSDDNGELRWYTPSVECGLLGGTMRRYLLDQGEILERAITKQEFIKAAKEGRGIRCFNSVRKVYDVILVSDQ